MKKEKVEKVKKPKSKVVKIIEWVLFVIFGGVFAFILAANISGMISKEKNFGQTIRFGVGNFIVLTDSMEPEYKVNTSIITYQESVESIEEKYNKGETIELTFMNRYCGIQLEDDDIKTPQFKKANGGQAVVTNYVMTHRLREIHIDPSKEVGSGRYIFITSGINVGGEASKEGQYQVFTEVEYLGVVKYNSVALGNFFGFISSPIGLIVLLLIPAGYLIVTSAIDIFKAMKEGEDDDTTNGGSNSKAVDDMSKEEKERLKQELLQEMLEKKKGGSKDA